MRAGWVKLPVSHAIRVGLAAISRTWPEPILLADW